MIDGIREIINLGRSSAYQVVSTAQVMTYWNIGRQIVEERHGEDRAEYGTRLIEGLAHHLTQE